MNKPDAIDRDLLLNFLREIESFTHSDCYADVCTLINDMPTLNKMDVDEYMERMLYICDRLGLLEDEEAKDD